MAEAHCRFGAAFFMDSGSSCGEISGHAKSINAVAVRQQRPFRAVSASDDNSVIFHTAVPFKYDKMISTHSRFVRDVAYSADGETFVSVGSDGKLFFCDGKTGEVMGEADRGGATSSLVSVGDVSSCVDLRLRCPGAQTRRGSLLLAQMGSSRSVSEKTERGPKADMQGMPRRKRAPNHTVSALMSRRNRTEWSTPMPTPSSLFPFLACSICSTRENHRRQNGVPCKALPKPSPRVCSSTTRTKRSTPVHSTAASRHSM